MLRRLLNTGAIVLGLIVATIAAVNAFVALHPQPHPTAGGAVTSGMCSPGPCAEVRGFTLWISDVKVEGDTVSMHVTFRNFSAATHASPEDLQLVDSGGHASGLLTGAPGCDTWIRHEFSHDATFGPIPVCFHVSDATPPLTLRWSPDLGLFCCNAVIKLT